MKSNEYIQTEINERYLQVSRLFGSFYDHLLEINKLAIDYMLDDLSIPRWIIPNIIRNHYMNLYMFPITKGYKYNEEFPITELSKEDARIGFITYYAALAINMKNWFGEELMNNENLSIEEDDIKEIIKGQPLFFLRDTVNDEKIRRI